MIHALLVVLLVAQIWLVYQGQKLSVIQLETREHNIQVLRLLRNKLEPLSGQVDTSIHNGRATFAETVFTDREAAAWMEGQRRLDDPE
tara:strand:+ start:794 stop:1057 length:264 start_codon:yes stop_codon:yes gene_type:complete